MTKIIRTNSKHQDFIGLVKQLDSDLAEKDGEEHSFYAQFNTLTSLNNVIVLYDDDQPIACGALKVFNTGSMEIKRMYTIPKYRGKGIATKVLIGLENWTLELGFTSCLLETGKRQPEAIALYQKNNYQRITNYGQYAGIENSVCFEKQLSKKT